jgi:hypothetical protein
MENFAHKTLKGREIVLPRHRWDGNIKMGLRETGYNRVV